MMLQEEDDFKDSEMEELVDLLIVRYLSYIVVSPLESIINAIPILRRQIDSFSISDSPIFFGFQRNDLHELYGLLRFPDIVTFDNRMSLPGEDVFFYRL
jgi:hypothetical protein